MDLEPHADLTSSTIFGLGFMYLILFAMNIGWTVRSFKNDGHVRVWRIFGGFEIPYATYWATYSVFVFLFALAHFTSANSPETFLIRMPEWFKSGADSALALWNGALYFIFSFLVLGVLVLGRRQFARPTVRSEEHTSELQSH